MNPDPMPSCVFCAIIAGAAPASFVRRDADVVAFMDLHPITPGHVLVVPTRHAVRIADLAPEEWAHVATVAREVGAALRRASLRCDDVHWFVADGPGASQDVPHVHVHLVPRFRGDGFGLRLPAGYGPPAPRDELDAGAARIRGTA